MRLQIPTGLREPARLLPVAFLTTIALGTALLMLPGTTAGPGEPKLVTAFFTSVSAVCVTGLTVVDTGTYWSPVGQAIILALIQVGGFGITALATLVVMVVMGKLGIRTRLAAAQETRTLAVGEVGRVLRRVALTMLAVEAAAAAILTLRFRLGYGESFARALWDGLFHAVSAFNNAGFSIYSNSLVRYAEDGVVVVVICVAVVLGGLGFPVLVEVYRSWRNPRRWSVHTFLTVWGTLALLVVGFLGVLAFEWRNPATMGYRDLGDRLLVAIFHAVQPRTAGFNTVSMESLRQETLTLNLVLMFIGGGSAGTAGGVKVTTVAVLAFVAIAEARGTRDVVINRRRIATETQRQAATILVIAATAVFAGAMAITALSRYTFGEALFEATSAFSTVGLSVGVTGAAGDGAHLVLIVLMFIGRVGPVAAFALFAKRAHQTMVTYPEARPLVG